MGEHPGQQPVLFHGCVLGETKDSVVMTAALTTCRWLYAEHCTWTPSWMPHNVPAKWDLLLTRLTDETTEAQRGDVICSGSCSL